mmetsp:Transcript_22293/g.55762  ORF Transcript_22293/g.55762 Transcript_22293/m.55762 type:complete len:300 (-) Transcript_22293:125-1024(-)
MGEGRQRPLHARDFCLHLRQHAAACAVLRARLLAALLGRAGRREAALGKLAALDQPRLQLRPQPQRRLHGPRRWTAAVVRLRLQRHLPPPLRRPRRRGHVLRRRRAQGLQGRPPGARDALGRRPRRAPAPGEVLLRQVPALRTIRHPGAVLARLHLSRLRAAGPRGGVVGEHHGFDAEHRERHRRRAGRLRRGGGDGAGHRGGRGAAGPPQRVPLTEGGRVVRARTGPTLLRRRRRGREAQGAEANLSQHPPFRHRDGRPRRAPPHPREARHRRRDGRLPEVHGAPCVADLADVQVECE